MRGSNLEISYLPMVLFSIPFNELPCKLQYIFPQLEVLSSRHCRCMQSIVKEPLQAMKALLHSIYIRTSKLLAKYFLALVYLNPSWLVWAEIGLMGNVALSKPPLNQFTLEPVCCKNRQIQVPDQLLFWGMRDL